jgi:hypothetical protein
MNRLRDVRGCNYLPMALTSHAVPLGWLSAGGDPATGLPVEGKDGFFSLTHLRCDLDMIKRSGFNSIRALDGFISYLANPADFLNNLRVLCDELYARRMGISYQVWSAVPAGAGSQGSPLLGAQSLATAATAANVSLESVVWSLAESYQVTAAAATPPNERQVSFWPAPMASAEWDTQGAYAAWADTSYKAKVAAYLTAIGTLFRTGTPRLVLDSFDLCNELDVWWIGSATRKANTLSFMRTTYDGLRAAFGDSFDCTVGFAGDTIALTLEVMAQGVPLTHYSFHSYDRAAIVAYAPQVAAAAASAGLPAQCTEFFRPDVDYDGTMTDYMDALDSAGVSGYMWCYIRNSHFPPVDGIVRPDKAAKLVKLKERYGFATVQPRNDARVKRWTGAV